MVLSPDPTLTGPSRDGELFTVENRSSNAAAVDAVCRPPPRSRQDFDLINTRRASPRAVFVIAPTLAAR